MTPYILGLAGYRQVGKSHIADHLVSRHGFQKVHPFNGGKVATRAYYEHIGIDAKTAWEMTDGCLKDVPCEKLPGGVNSRFFMERFGKFMGVDMGPEWTIGEEIKILQRKGASERLLVESLVYEDMVIRSLGGVIWKIVRPGVDKIPGLETDTYTEKMLVDEILINDKPSLEDLYRDVDAFVEEKITLAGHLELTA